MRKTTKQDAGYESKSRNPDTICKGCIHFEAPHYCEKVEGAINPTGWCEFFRVAGRTLKSIAGYK